MAGEIFEKITGKDIDGLTIQEINKEIEKSSGEYLRLTGVGYPFDVVDTGKGKWEYNLFDCPLLSDICQR